VGTLTGSPHVIFLELACKEKVYVHNW